MKPVKIEEHSVNFTFFQTENLQGEFIPWQRYENGQQVFIKMTRGTETGLLYAGEHRIMDAEIQQALIRLVNDGWKAAGEVTVTFDGTDEPGVDPYVFQDPVTVELGQALLPLVDPQNKAPLISMLPGVRDEVAKETGLVAAGIRIKDNLALQAIILSISIIKYFWNFLFNNTYNSISLYSIKKNKIIHKKIQNIIINILFSFNVNWIILFFYIIG